MEADSHDGGAGGLEGLDEPRASFRRRPFVSGALAALLVGCKGGPRPPAGPALAARPAPTPPVRPTAPPTERAASCALFASFPALVTRVPRAALATLPTPVERLTELGRILAVDALYVKRDEVTGSEYGGGKTRKLVFLLGDAEREGKKELVTFGGVGSNHALATTLYARRIGARVRLLLLPEPSSDRVRRNLLLCRKHGADIEITPSLERGEAIARAIPRAYVISAGGSSAVGNLGFVDAGFELAQQIADGDLPEPDDIYMAMGTMGAAVGLALGVRAAGLRSRVVAVRASSPGTSSPARMRELYERTAAHLRALDPSFPAVPFDRAAPAIAAEHLGAGYARETEKGRRAERLAALHGALALETTYTAKAMAALVDRAPRDPKRVALFWNTHNASPLDASGVGPADLPRELRAYFAARDGGAPTR
jgi:D-cysteine desulfhydrase